MALKRAGKTVFFTSHALADIEELGDTLAVLHNQQLKFHGTPGELKQRYARERAMDLESAFLNCIDEA